MEKKTNFERTLFDQTTNPVSKISKYMRIYPLSYKTKALFKRLTPLE